MWSEYYSDTTVLVGGGSTGIGAAAVEGFARAGATTIVTDVADEIGEGLAQSLRDEGCAVAYRHCDVSVESDVLETFEWAQRTYGALDVVFANAGIEWTQDVRHTTLAQWQRILDVNLTGMFLVGRSALRIMCDQAHGSIVMTSSPHAVATVPDSGAYAASKGGVHALVRALALEGAPHGVRVNAVVPGTIDTPMVRREALASSDPDAQLALMAAGQPLGRIGQPVDVANAVVFLLSDQAAWITGQVLCVDGGSSVLPSQSSSCALQVSAVGP